MVDVTVIIVSYNSHRDIAEAVDALETGDGQLKYEVVVVDNASPDGSGSALARRYANRQDVTVLQNAINLGFAEACNEAALHAQGRYLLLLNPDARITRETMDRAVTILDAQETIGCLGPALVDGRGELTFSCRRAWDEGYLAQRHILPARIADRLGRRSTRHLAGKGDVVDVGWLLGACIFVRRSLWARLGGLDGRFFLSADDTADLCYRARSVGCRAVFVPGLVAFHRGGSTWTKLRRFTMINVYNGHLLFAKKHLGSGAAARLKLLFFVSSLVKCALASMLRLAKFPLPVESAAAHWEACKWLASGRIGEVGAQLMNTVERRAAVSAPGRGGPR